MYQEASDAWRVITRAPRGFRCISRRFGELREVLWNFRGFHGAPGRFRNFHESLRGVSEGFKAFQDVPRAFHKENVTKTFLKSMTNFVRFICCDTPDTRWTVFVLTMYQLETEFLEYVPVRSSRRAMIKNAVIWTRCGFFCRQDIIMMSPFTRTISGALCSY